VTTDQLPDSETQTNDASEEDVTHSETAEFDVSQADMSQDAYMGGGMNSSGTLYDLRQN
jgi:hypothetical protein